MKPLTTDGVFLYFTEKSFGNLLYRAVYFPAISKIGVYSDYLRNCILLYTYFWLITTCDTVSSGTGVIFLIVTFCVILKWCNHCGLSVAK